jgi:hypothetical protein
MQQKTRSGLATKGSYGFLVEALFLGVIFHLGSAAGLKHFAAQPGGKTSACRATDLLDVQKNSGL